MIKEPLRRFFSLYVPEEFRYAEEGREGVIITTVYDPLQHVIQKKPRILIDRGPYTVSKMSLTEGMAQGTLGREGYLREYLYFVEGQASITIEATSQGTCERLVDFVHHFLIWCRPAICDELGFKDFAPSITVSGIQQSEEDREKFMCQISFSYMKEEQHKVTPFVAKIKDIVLDMSTKP